jgi:hypothetical protein
MDSYGGELLDLLREMHRPNVAAEVRGSDAARFIFAQCDDRAIELSRDGQCWFAEFWAGETLVNDHSFVSASEAVSACNAWMKPMSA